MSESPAKKVKITLNKSLIGRPDKHRRVAYGLGLKKTSDSTVLAETVTIRGMINTISHLLTVEAV